MKKILTILSSGIIIISSSLTSITAFKTENYQNNLFERLSKSNNLKKYQRIQSQHLSDDNPYRQNLTHSPTNIINHINVNHFYVPNDTNPNLNNSDTQNTIKQNLKKNNPYITSDDLKIITIRVDASSVINNNDYTSLYVLATKGSDLEYTKVWVEIAKNQTKAINLYNPLYGEVDQNNIEDSYLDDIFLKTLVYNNQTKQVTINSNQLKNQQDIKDFKSKMSNNDGISQGLVLLNRYLKNGFLQFNKNGYIPTRSGLLNSKGAEKQTLITVSLYKNQLTSQQVTLKISDFLTLNIHWDKTILILKPELIAATLEHFINELITTFIAQNPEAFDESSIWTELDAGYIGGISGMLFFAFSTMIMTLIDALTSEFPPIDLVLDPLWITISALIAGIITYSVKTLFDPTTPNNYFSDIDGYYPNDPKDKVTYHPFDPNINDKAKFNVKFTIYYFKFWDDSLAINYNKNLSPVLANGLSPSEFNPGLGIQSMISGNTNDFTIAANSGKLADFVDLIAPDGFAKDIGDVFKNMEWHNSKNFPKLTLNILKSIYLKYDFWYVPTGYMAIIHVKKINNQFQIVWSNLNNQQGKKSLVDSGAGYLTTSILKQDNNLETLINEKNYLNIESRYMWIKNNWQNIKNNVTQTSWQQYFHDYVIKLNGINMYQLNLNNTTDLNLFINNLNILSTIFKNQVKSSHSFNSNSQVVNIFYNQNDPLNINIQSN